ncbi:MAG: DUF2071 domain-containing protein [Bdellovibrionales bacterium]|nr:DUF2071 domain-containing protein [Bdellovibrionales bacterium]
MPGAFDSAIPFGPKWPINFLVGVFEITLALGFFSKKYGDLSARLSALWFICLTPIHIYVSWNQIPMFGVSNPAMLWLRTALQPALYFWALSLQTKGWIMAQVWKDVVFLHYKVDPEVLQKELPFKLDLYEGQAILSIVSFTMDRIRFPFLPTVPGLSKLNELNLRTYVEVNGIKGVYFFTLDADHLPGIGIGRIFFSLPYRFAKISIDKVNSRYVCESKNSSRSFGVVAEVGLLRPSNHFDLWATERYGLFTKKSGETLHGIVQHDPWCLQNISISSIQDNFTTQLGQHLKASEFIAPAYCKELSVRFRPFYKMNSL